MCGRFSLSTPPEIVAKLFDLGLIPRLSPRFNIAPTQSVAVIRAAQHESNSNTNAVKSTRQLDMLHWGLIPHWAEDPSIGNRMINAKAETAAEKPAFRDAFKKRRCLVPADGFYEWLKLDPAGKNKQPYRLARPDNQPFAFAGLWSYWRDPTNPDPGAIESFTILTTEPNAVARAIHNRMPAIIRPEDYQAWLDPSLQDVEAVKQLIKPTPDDELIAYPISKRVNSPKNDDAGCLVRFEEGGQAESPPASRGKAKRRPGSAVQKKDERSLFD